MIGDGYSVDRSLCTDCGLGNDEFEICLVVGKHDAKRSYSKFYITATGLSFQNLHVSYHPT